MPYVHCPRCRLQIKIRTEFMRIENCPRCLARGAKASPLVLSANWISPAASKPRSAAPSDERGRPR